MDDRFRSVAVHVEDRRLDDVRRRGAVGPRARVRRRRGEADLVVDDDVDRAADAIAATVGGGQRLRDQSLPDERRVAMQPQLLELYARFLNRVALQYLKYVA